MNNQTTRVSKAKIFVENPYDIETFFESLSAATDHDKELLFVDMLITSLRLHPKSDVTEICFNILTELDIITPSK